MRKGIADVDCFEDNPGLLMYGMTCVIMAVGIWLLLASYLEMPVSTTHSCVGGIVGMTMMARGSECVVWNEPVDECTFDNFPCVKGVSAIVVSWVLSPVASGICAAIIYFLTYHLVLKDAATSFQRAKYAFPVIVGFTIGVNAMFFVLKGTKSKAEELGTDDIVQEAKAGNLGPVAIVGAISFACAAVVTALITPYLSGKVEETIAAQKAAEPAEIEVTEAGAKDADKTVDAAVPAAESAITGAAVLDTAIDYVKVELDKDAHDVLKTDARAHEIHEHVSRHDPRCEEMFKYVQVFTAIVDSFSHGANDVANAMGPFSAVYITWKNGEVSSKEDLGDNMYWILAIGGVGIVVGLALYGYKIMSAIGVKLTAITPSRGYSIELGAAFVIIYGTSKGWPLSTTHCQIGATVGVGLFEGAQGVNVRVLLKCVFGWVITLIVVGITSALLVGPNPNPDKDVYCDYEGQDWLSYIDDANITAYVNSQQL